MMRHPPANDKSVERRLEYPISILGLALQEGESSESQVIRP
jgi:hypothetical protein